MMMASVALTLRPHPLRIQTQWPKVFSIGQTVMAASLRSFSIVAIIILVSACALEVAETPLNLQWPDPPRPARIKYLRSLSGMPSTRNWLDRITGEETILRDPYGITTDRQGKIYVADTERGAVVVFDENRNQIGFLRASIPGGLRQPIGLAINDRGIVFVSDISLKSVFGFDSEGRLVIALGQKNELDSPAGLAIDSRSARLYVADPHRHKVRAYDSDNGKFLFEFGQAGTKDGEFNFPTNLFIRAGKVYVSDSANSRIQVFDLDGKFLKKVGGPGTQPRRFARPRGVAVDSDGQIYVADALLNNLQVSDGDGRLLFRIGSFGKQPGHFALPAGIHIDENDRIYVVDSFNHRVQIFQYLGNHQVGKASVTRLEESLFANG